MAILHLDALPPQTTKGTIVRLLTQVGEIDKQRIGNIAIQGRSATVEVPDTWAARLAKKLDGTDLANRHIRAWPATAPSTGNREDHFERMIRLLEMEAVAEAEQIVQSQRRLSPAQAEKAGTSLINMTLRDEAAGLGGRVLVTLGKKSREPLPWTRLGIGSPVVLSEQESDEHWRGVVSYRGSHTIEVAMPQPLPSAEAKTAYRIDVSTDEVARQRQRVAMERARSASGDRLAQLRSVFLGETTPTQQVIDAAEKFDGRLNASQIDAIRFALGAKDLSMIHGPPGTGKTTTVVEVIRRAVARGDKVLACAPSNMAVDNLFEKLLTIGARVVRLGHPARVMPELRTHTLDLMVDDHEDMQLAKKLTRDAHALYRRSSRFTRAKPAPGERHSLREEAKNMLADAQRLERQVIQQILDNADILCATLTGLDSTLLGRRRFEWLVIDEACQTTEPTCWIPLSVCERVLLAGDHCQLPPTVVSREAASEGFAVSLFERLMELHGEQVSRRLTVQYRMHEQIMSFSSQQFYESELIADASVRHHLLHDLPDIELSEATFSPVAFVDTAGAGFDDELEPDGESRRNPGEAELVRRKVQALRETGLAASDIAVIAPYAAQVRLLRDVIDTERLEIDTVDGFQGREKEAVIISLVRSNSNGDIGFLADVRRMNVALTRARRKLIVVGDSATIGTHLFYQQMLDYFEQIGAYHTVWEEPDLL
ncbi:MAG: AAA family ATPase [Planctomycetaceae bacterium]|nr:AAA family ATPase [Planctomycetales bacterium]MCB9923449.1 AAA family ATPase [Planctomycetaceae bacterium]